MTPLPGALGGAGLSAWRLETARHFGGWQTAEGSFLFGGRWSPVGRRVLYTSIDPATAILEVGVHKGFDVLDAVPHMLLELRLANPAAVHVATPPSIPHPEWLRPGTPSTGQQVFGGALLDAHPVLLVPSVVSTHSWNLLIDITADAAAFTLHSHEAFALDPRLAATPLARKR